MSPAQGARLIESVAFAITVAIVTYIVVSTVGTLAGILLAIAVMIARPIVLVHMSVLSEPLFLCALAATLLGMLRRWHPLVVGTIAAAGALVRYAGIAVVAAAVLWQFVQPGSIRRRLARALMAGLPTVVFFGAWVVHTRVESGESGIRQFGIYGNLSEALSQGGRTIAAWLVPTADPPTTTQLWIAVAAGLIVALVTSVGTRQTARSDDESRRALTACALLICCYSAVLIVSRLTADANIPFDERILAPLILLVMIAVGVAVGGAWRGWGLLLRGSLASLFLVWLGMSALAVSDDVSWATSYGSDFAGEDWRNSTPTSPRGCCPIRATFQSCAPSATPWRDAAQSSSRSTRRVPTAFRLTAWWRSRDFARSRDFPMEPSTDQPFGSWSVEVQTDVHSTVAWASKEVRVVRISRDANRMYGGDAAKDHRDLQCIERVGPCHEVDVADRAPSSDRQIEESRSNSAAEQAALERTATRMRDVEDPFIDQRLHGEPGGREQELFVRFEARVDAGVDRWPKLVKTEVGMPADSHCRENVGGLVQQNAGSESVTEMPPVVGREGRGLRALRPRRGNRHCGGEQCGNAPSRYSQPKQSHNGSCGRSVVECSCRCTDSYPRNVCDRNCRTSKFSARLAAYRAGPDEATC
jgi:hypothetical protein